MVTPDLVKLAPNLSAEERYKLVFGDLLGRMEGKPPVLSESELNAVLRFESRATWQEYALRVCMMRIASNNWTREIEAEKLRAYAFYLHLSHQLERAVTAIDVGVTKEKRMKRFEEVKRDVIQVHDALEGFYVYREAIPKLEHELWDTPFFGKPLKASIAMQFMLIGESVSHHNDSIRSFCECHDAKKFIRPIVDDMESYLIPEVVPSKDSVDALVDEIKQLAASEMKSRE